MPARLQRELLKLPCPELAKLNVPLGNAPPGDVSETVAVQVVGARASTAPGAQLTFVATGRTTLRVVHVWPAVAKPALISCVLGVAEGEYDVAQLSDAVQLVGEKVPCLAKKFTVTALLAEVAVQIAD